MPCINSPGLRAKLYSPRDVSVRPGRGLGPEATSWKDLYRTDRPIRMPSTMNKTVLAFLAHPDDAEFSCAGTLIRLKSLGWQIHIASATRGDCGTMTHTREEISAIRTKEATEAAKLIGASFDTLDERDLMVVYDKPTIQKTIDLFRGIAPSLVFTHAPKDYMMDHDIVSLLARCASFGYGAPNASQVPRSPKSMVPHLYYCDPPEVIDPLG